MKSIEDVFNLEDYKLISNFFKEKNKWYLANKVLDLASNAYRIGQESMQEIYNKVKEETKTS